jgi:hypothetical protein
MDFIIGSRRGVRDAGRLIREQATTCMCLLVLQMTVVRRSGVGESWVTGKGEELSFVRPFFKVERVVFVT